MLTLEIAGGVLLALILYIEYCKWCEYRFWKKYFGN